MSGLNRVQLIGHLGKDPEIRSFQNGGRVAHFTLATSQTWKDKDGNRKERTEWHRVSVLAAGLVGLAEKYLKKGGRVYIEGQLETREYTDKENVKRQVTEIILRPFGSRILMLDSRAAREDDDPLPAEAAETPGGWIDESVPS